MDFGLSELAPKKYDIPTTLEQIHYLFFTYGISLVEFNKLPIPYILSIVRTHTYIKEQEAKDLKKARRHG